MVVKAFFAITAYLLGTYIYSPQFNILLLPILALIDVQHPALYLWDGFNALIILTWFIQPNPTLAGTWPQLFALLRTGSLAWLAVAVAGIDGRSITSWLKVLMRRPMLMRGPAQPVT